MPTFLSFGEQQDVVQGGVCMVKVTYAAQASSLKMKNNIPILIHGIRAISRNDGSDLVCCG
jgi:hypothetical protein